jgi:hypothetical protein
MFVSNEAANVMRVGLSMGEEEKLHHQNNTDNVVHNLDLSQQRTNAVKTQLVNMGIDEFSLHSYRSL